MSSYQDVISSAIGDFGKAQVLIVIACKLPSAFAAWSMIMMSFAGAQPKWWSIKHTFNSTSNISSISRLLKTCPIGNETIEFEKGIYTIVSEWSLVCDRGWIPTVITTSQMIGVCLGAAIVGQLADWIGRKKCFFIIYAMDLIFILIQGFSVNWYMMTVTAFLVGFSLGGFLVVVNIFLLEFIHTKYRTSCALVPAWGLGVVIFGALFSVLPNWRHLCIANAAIGSPALLFIWFSPESIRWLFTKGRIEEGKEALKKLAKWNGRTASNLETLKTMLESQDENEKTKKTYTYISLFRYEYTVWRAPVFGFMWFYCTFAYYGLTLGVSSLNGNLSINMALMGLGESVSLLIVWLLSKKLGRKNTTVLCMTCMALTSFGVTLAYVIDIDYENVKSVLAITSRFFLSAAWASIVIFSVESFPTNIRAVAYGFASVCGRIGGIVAPQNKILSDQSDHLPFTVNGGLAVISCILCLFLQDTYNGDMADHLPENKNRVKDENITEC